MQNSHKKFCKKDAEGRKIKGGKEVRKDIGTEDLGEYFDTVLKVVPLLTSVDVEQNVEAARKMYKSEEKSKVVKKAKSGKVKKPKSQKTRASK